MYYLHQFLKFAYLIIIQLISIVFLKGEKSMLNQTVLVGRIVKDPELRETENGNKVTNITLAVPRSYKNINGEYETDFIPCILWKGIAENTVEYVGKGDLIGVKGHVQSRNIEIDENNKKQTVEIIAEKVTFLSSSKNKTE